MFPYKEGKEAKKEAFRKYLESSGVLDALTKVLVALYEQNDKPSSALEFVQQKLGGPSLSEYEKLQSEKSDLQMKYNQLLASHQQISKELEKVTRAGEDSAPGSFAHENEVEVPKGEASKDIVSL